MCEIRTLLFLELRSLYGINRFIHTRDKKAKKRYGMLGVVWLMLIGMILSYVGGMVYGLCFLGLADIVPAYLVVLSSLLVLVFGLFKAGNRIFGQKGYDILASMPLTSRSIVISRFLSLYIEDLLVTLLIMLPGTLVYGICQKPDFGFYLMAFLGALFVPALPLVISTLLGTLIFAVSSRMKSKSMVQTVLMVLLVVGVLIGSFGMSGMAEDFTLEQISALAKTIGDLLGKIYPPAMWLGHAMIEGNILLLGLFVLLSIAVAVCAVWLVSVKFHTILRRLKNITAKHQYQLGAMEAKSLLKALYVREAKRYFSSSIYVTNTIIGPIMGAILSVALCILGLDTITDVLPIELDIAGLVPFLVAAVFCMMTTTCTSISMEGKQFWVIKSLPIPAKTLLDSKILLNLSLMLPFYLVSVIAMAIAIRPNVLQFLWVLLIPASLMLFSVVFGITVNLKIYSFDWEKEETVVKQSAPAALGGFAGLLLSLILGGSVFLIPPMYGDMARLAGCLLLWSGTAILYRKNNRICLRDL